MNAIRINPSTAKLRVPVGEHKLVALTAYTALAEMCNGTARREEWQDLASSVNVVEALACMGKLPEAEVSPAVQLAIEGLMVAIKCPDGMMRMGPAATLAMRQIVTWHDDAIGKFSRLTLWEAWEMVQQRIADPKANASNGLFVVNA